MTLDKTITYDRETRDYRMELDGQFIGYAPNYRDAEVTLNQTAYEWLIHGYTATATDLDDDTCPDCDGDGYFPSNGCGDASGGWAETCDTCNGRGRLTT